MAFFVPTLWSCQSPSCIQPPTFPPPLEIGWTLNWEGESGRSRPWAQGESGNGWVRVPARDVVGLLCGALEAVQQEQRGAEEDAGQELPVRPRGGGGGTSPARK